MLANGTGKVVVNFATGHEDADRCPICFTARGLDERAFISGGRVAGATAIWEWIGEKMRRCSAANRSRRAAPSAGTPFVRTN